VAALAACVIAAAAAAVAQKVTTIPMDAMGITYRVRGRTGEPLGRMVTLHGVVVRGNRFKGDWSEPVLLVQRINGHATQDCIEVPIRPYATDFGKPYFVANLEGPDGPDAERSLPRLEYGRTYEFRGFETGGFVGDPDEAALDGGVCKQRAGFYFTSEFVVVKGKNSPRIVFSPPDFLGRKALVHGRASNHGGKAWLADNGWQVEVLSGGAWPESMLNARVAVTGVIGKEPGAKFPHIKDCRVRRDHLEDQIGRCVELRGEAIEFNSHWYLRYNYQDVLVENMKGLAAANSLTLRSPVEIRGVLRRERLRDELSSIDNTVLREQYIVRQAVCVPVDDLLPIERREEPCPWSIGGR
jgi:hypothetical protein